MVLIMKSLSLSIDISNGFNFNGCVIEYFSYFISIGTAIFGPWISYAEHLDYFTKKKSLVSHIWFYLKKEVLGFHLCMFKIKRVEKKWCCQVFCFYFSFIHVPWYFKLFYEFNGKFNRFKINVMFLFHLYSNSKLFLKLIIKVFLFYF